MKVLLAILYRLQSMHMDCSATKAINNGSHQHYRLVTVTKWSLHHALSLLQAPQRWSIAPLLMRCDRGLLRFSM